MKRLDSPCSEEAVRALRAGDTVSLSGRVLTGRDRAHKHLYDGGECPAGLANGTIYHCGPVVTRRDSRWVVHAAGPTTSMREEPYMARIIERCGLRVIVGKGGMGEATRQACARHGCVYLQAVGGAACVIAGRIVAVHGVHFAREFGLTEAMWDLEFKDLEAVVTMDATGRSLHDRVARRSRRALAGLLRKGG